MIVHRVGRRIGAHNWFAVVLDFVIVVVGILLALQISNWDEQRRARELERAYLVRLASELRANIAEFADDREAAVSTSKSVAAFAAALRDSSTTDDVLVGSAKGFFDGAWTTPDFSPSATTFTDLSSTGNLQVIRNAALREAVIALYDAYQASISAVEINTSWVLPNDARLAYEYDALRWDARTSGLFPERTNAQAARELRAQRQVLLRHTAAYYWIYDSVLEAYSEAAAQSQFVLDRIAAELNER